MVFQPIFKFQAAAAAILAGATIAFTGCGGGSSVSGAGCMGYGGGGGGSGSCVGNPAPTPTPAATPVGMLLTGENPVTMSGVGAPSVLGYFNGTAGNPPNGSQVVHLTANTNVQFVNVESAGGFGPHTASFLGTWSGSYPSTFTNTNGTTASAAGASISSANFSSGQVNPGQGSAVYSSGGPGMLIFGCSFHYLSNHMRTVIVVM